jgi:hypothetical protein
VQVGEDGGDRYGVRDVRFAGQAPLAFMGLGTEQVGLVDLLDLGFGEIETELGEKLFYTGRPLASDYVE